MADEPAVSRSFMPDEDFARQLDESDPLRAYRDQFLLPRRPDGSPQVYFCGHSLGLQPVTARALVEQELDDWERSQIMLLRQQLMQGAMR